MNQLDSATTLGVPHLPRRTLAGARGLRLGVPLLSGVAMGACAPLDDADPDRILQGGALTVFDATSMAYDTPANAVSVDSRLLERWTEGDMLYDTPRVASPAEVPGTGGLGPLYVGKACATCHMGAGRTLSTLFTSGGTGGDVSVFLAFLQSRNGQYFNQYGRVLHDHAIQGYEPEGELRVEYTEQCSRFPTPDAEVYCLITPRYWIENGYAEEIPDSELILSVRTPLRHVGLGLMMAIDRNELSALAAISYPEYGISPRLQQVFEQGKKRIGFSGHKAHHADLTVELGWYSDMGVTTDRFPEEVGAGQLQEGPKHAVDISSYDVASVDLYLKGLGVPARRNVEAPEVRRGQSLFDSAQCTLCHAPTLHTTTWDDELASLTDGTRLPFLLGQTIHPYSDFLLHDMGPELGDEYVSGEATGSEWRTAPLWGIGLQEVVSGHTHFMHDGRARDLTEAILWHGGEGSVSRELFLHMPAPDRLALAAFLRSL